MIHSARVELVGGMIGDIYREARSVLELLDCDKVIFTFNGVTCNLNNSSPKTLTEGNCRKVLEAVGSRLDKEINLYE
jgi:hypothetical protein